MLNQYDFNKHVNWTKIKGDTYRTGERGFGMLSTILVGKRMLITGDYGVGTTNIKSIELTLDGIVVTTENSTYLVQDWESLRKNDNS